jgi:hypothetical protein
MIGKNLSIDNSFTLRFVNTTSTPFTFNLFNLGAVGQNNQTTLITQNLRSTYNLAVSDLSTTGVFTSATTFNVKDVLGNTLATANMLIGQTVANLLAAINPITDLQGNTGEMYIQKTPNGITGKEYDFVFTLDSVTRFEFTTGGEIANPSLSLVSYVINNPFIYIQGVVPITVIQQSETGNAYRIMGVDVISNDSEQLLQEVTYGNREPNGNRWLASFTPTIDPYQDNNISIHALGGQATGNPMDDFTINSDTTFSYVVLGNSFSRITFNYVKASIGYMREFDQALATELSMRFLKQKNYLDSLKGGTLLLQ